MCASPNTLIATPAGERAIAELGLGDLVYSNDHGAIVAVPIVRIRRNPVHDHRVVRVVFESGRTLEVSGSHPLGDGRSFEDLRAGSRVGDAGIVSATSIPYQYDATYDILPASETGIYFAAGVPIGSTLGP
jgi:hypothetical protein